METLPKPRYDRRDSGGRRRTDRANSSPYTYWRIIQLHELLVQEHPVTLGLVEEVIGLKGRTAQRLIETMRRDFNAPILWDKLRKVYYYGVKTFALPAALMNAREAVAVALACQARSQEDLPLADHFVSGVKKFLEQLPSYVTVDLHELMHRVSFSPHPSRPVDPRTLDVLTNAMDSGRTVHMKYYTASRNVLTRRSIDPYHLTNLRGDWYVVGHCHERQDVRTFAVSRIRSIAMEPGTFTVPDSFDPDTWFKDAFGVIRGSAPEHVVLLFDAHAARWIRERTWHSGQRLVELPGGSLRLELEVGVTVELRQWILSHGSHVKVLQPMALARAIAADLDLAIRQYDII